VPSARESKAMEPKTTFYEMIEFPEHESLGGKYRHAEIKVYIRDKAPTKYSDESFTITYQEHLDKETKTWSGYYAEKICEIKPDPELLKDISMLFGKMSKFQETLYKKGLRIDAPYNDEYLIRCAIFKGLKSTRFIRDSETGEISLLSAGCA
jgi:hypothetical protein